MKKLSLFIFVAMLLLQGCSFKPKSTSTILPDPTQQSTQSDNINTSAKTSTATEITTDTNNTVIKGTITSDALRVRKAADTSSDIIQTLSKGTVVDILSKTDAKKAVGASSNYWYQISANNKTGWCFGDYISINPNYVEKIKSAIASINSGEKIIFLQLANDMQEYAKNVDNEALVEEVVTALREVQDKLLAEYSNKLSSLKIPSEYKDADFKSPEKIKETDIKKFATEVKDNGFVIYIVEGMPNIEVNPKFLLSRFKQGMSEKTLDYYTLIAAEVDKHAVADGALIISWEDLSSRLASWQSFMEKYVGTDEAKSAKSNYHDKYLYFYITGIPNTPIFDLQSGILDNKLKVSYEQFVVKYRNTKDADIVKRVYLILEKNDFKRSDELNRFTIMYAPQY